MKVTFNLGDSLTLYEFERGRFVYDDMLNIKFKIGIHFNQLNEIHFYSKGQEDLARGEQFGLNFGTKFVNISQSKKSIELKI